LLKLDPSKDELISYIDYPVEDGQGPQGIAFDYDGDVDAEDLAIFSNNFGTVVNPLFLFSGEA
jgi:hypothetical protein